MNQLLTGRHTFVNQKESNKELVEMLKNKWVQLSLFMVVVLLLAACATVVETIEEPAPIDTPLAELDDEPQEELVVDDDDDGPAGRTFQIDPALSQVSYSVDEEFLSGAITQLGKELGFFDTVGMTQAIEGQIVVDENSLEILSGEFVVDISTLTSDDGRRDRAIRTRFLQLDIYPLAVFVPQVIQGVPENYQEGDEAAVELFGEMTMRKITNPITFKLTVVFQDGIISGTAETSLLLTDYGFDPPVMGDLFVVGDEVRLSLSFTAEEINS